MTSSCIVPVRTMRASSTRRRRRRRRRRRLALPPLARHSPRRRGFARARVGVLVGATAVARRSTGSTSCRAAGATSTAEHGEDDERSPDGRREGVGRCASSMASVASRASPTTGRRGGMPRDVRPDDRVPCRWSPTVLHSPRMADLRLPFQPPLEPMLAKAVRRAARRTTAGCSSPSGTASGRSSSATATRSTRSRATSSRSTATSRSWPTPLRAALPERCVLDGEVVIARDGGLDVRGAAAAHPPGRVAGEDARRGVAGDLRRLGPARARRRGPARRRRRASGAPGSRPSSATPSRRST